MSKLIDLTGQRFGRLTVIRRAENDKWKKPQWLCQCDCGNIKIFPGNSLKSGLTRSCGCLKHEITVTRLTIHGGEGARLYHIWKNMRQRCFRSSNQDYSNYGGRGITVCDEWRYSFVAFRDWAIENGYRDDLTIDRIDVNGNYEPANCRWITMKAQQNNMRSNHYITFGGRTQTLTQWAEELNMSPSAIRYRLKSGWAIEKALTTPVDESKRHPKK